MNKAVTRIVSTALALCADANGCIGAADGSFIPCRATRCKPWTLLSTMLRERKMLLKAYRTALEARDADAMSALFAESSAIFENGKAEG